MVVMLTALSYKIASKEQSSDKQHEIEKKYQAKAPPTQFFGKEAFDKTNETIIRWLGMSGFLINSHGTTIMIDPVLKDFDMPLLIDMPIETYMVPHLDAVLITHSDNDH